VRCVHCDEGDVCWFVKLGVCGMGQWPVVLEGVSGLCPSSSAPNGANISEAGSVSVLR
jgi:hypothetical protein